MKEKADGGMIRYCATAPVCFLHWDEKLLKNGLPAGNIICAMWHHLFLPLRFLRFSIQ